MKMSIDWHKECLQNSISHAKHKRNEAIKAAKIADALDRNNALMMAQIELAEKEGKDGFDSEKYGLRRLIGV